MPLTCKALYTKFTMNHTINHIMKGSSYKKRGAKKGIVLRPILFL